GAPSSVPPLFPPIQIAPTTARMITSMINPLRRFILISPFRSCKKPAGQPAGDGNDNKRPLAPGKVQPYRERFPIKIGYDQKTDPSRQGHPCEGFPGTQTASTTPPPKQNGGKEQEAVQVNRMNPYPLPYDYTPGQIG